MPRSPVREVGIAVEPIRLVQFLKLAGLAEGGGDAKGLLEAGKVTVNGRPETRRAAQLTAGDVVAVADQRVRVVAARDE